MGLYSKSGDQSVGYVLLSLILGINKFWSVKKKEFKKDLVIIGVMWRTC